MPITAPGPRARALTKLVAALAAAGDHDRAAELAAAAETTAREIIAPGPSARALGELVVALAAAGDYDRAAELAGEITNPDFRARVLGELVV
ncbi:MAG: hypothetical protein LC721_03735, partial [Actinobacteria bacterium]|nr:hypothetical protein [Actinomycetota bacterium]